LIFKQTQRTRIRKLRGTTSLQFFLILVFWQIQDFAAGRRFPGPPGWIVSGIISRVLQCEKHDELKISTLDGITID
jgi:hypothetical protein